MTAMSMTGERYRWKHHCCANGNSEGEITKHGVTSRNWKLRWKEARAALGASGLPPLGARRGASRNRAQLTNADACLLFHKVRPAVPRAD